MPLTFRRHRWPALAALPALIGGVVLLGPSSPADASPEIVTSSVLSSAGELFTATNHLVDLPGIAPPGAERHRPKEYLVVWAGDANATDIIGADIKNAPLQVSPGRNAPRRATNCLDRTSLP